MLGGVVREHSVKTPNAYYCYFHMEILYVDIYKFVFSGLYNLMDIHFITFWKYFIV